MIAFPSTKGAASITGSDQTACPNAVDAPDPADMINRPITTTNTSQPLSRRLAFTIAS
jgi:hypothetical protein